MRLSLYGSKYLSLLEYGRKNRLDGILNGNFRDNTVCEYVFCPDMLMYVSANRKTLLISELFLSSTAL